MLQFTRNTLVLLVVGITLFISSTDVDARYRSYDIDVRRSDLTPYWSQYNISISDNTPSVFYDTDNRYNPCRYRCTNPDMHCINGNHYAKIPDISKIANRIHRERQQRQRHNAEMELLEAQTALLRQARRANSRPYRPPSEAVQQAAKKRLRDRLVGYYYKKQPEKAT